MAVRPLYHTSCAGLICHQRCVGRLSIRPAVVADVVDVDEQSISSLVGLSCLDERMLSFSFILTYTHVLTCALLRRCPRSDWSTATHCNITSTQHRQLSQLETEVFFIRFVFAAVLIAPVDKTIR